MFKHTLILTTAICAMAILTIASRTATAQMGGCQEITPQCETEKIISQVQMLVGKGLLNRGQGNALITTLEAAITQMDQEHINAATGLLQGFIGHVNGFINAGILTTDQGQGLINAAESVIEQLR